VTLFGHLATLAPFVRHAIAPAQAPSYGAWHTTLEDPDVGPVRLTGFLREHPGARSLLLVVHGLGGNATSHYAIPAATAAHAHGISCLRLNLRGADLDGNDFYHAGLTADLRAAIASVPQYEQIYLLGYSMGGHVVLRYAAESPDARVRAAASVCAPLDLELSAADFDRPVRVFYRYHVLSGLKAIYASVDRRRPVVFPVASAMRIRTIRSWDRHVVAPRFAFASAEDYYARVSAVSALPAIELPTLVVAAKADPMVPEATLVPALRHCSPSIDLRWAKRGGHVGFPPDLDLGLPAQRGLEQQIIAWFGRNART